MPTAIRSPARARSFRAGAAAAQLGTLDGSAMGSHSEQDSSAVNRWGAA
jgi:hypothetical protein